MYIDTYRYAAKNIDEAINDSKYALFIKIFITIKITCIYIDSYRYFHIQRNICRRTYYMQTRAHKDGREIDKFQRYQLELIVILTCIYR